MSEVKRVPTQHSFSSAVVAGDYVYLSHHRGFGSTFEAQLDDTFQRLDETLSKVSLTHKNLIKVNVWLKDIGDVPEMEKLFAQYFEQNEYPVRMSATTKFIDDDCLLMIDGIAYIEA